MDDNVFAPGGEHGSSDRSEGSAQAFVWTDRSVNDVLGLLSRAWELVVQNLGTIGIGIVILFGLGMISQMVNFAISVGVETISDPMTKIGVQVGVQYGVALLFIAIQMYFQLGLVKLVIQLDRGEEVELDMLWSQGSSWIQTVAVSIVLTFAYTVVFGVLGGGAGGLIYGIIMATDLETGLLAGLGLSILFFVVLLPVLIVVGLGLSMFMHGIVDERARFLGALPFSWNLTSGWKVFLFIQALVLLVLTLVVAVATCCVGLPVAQGIFICMQAVTYNAVISDADANERFLG